VLTAAVLPGTTFTHAIPDKPPNGRESVPQATLQNIARTKLIFRSTLSAKALESIARETRFVQRARLLTAESFFWAIIVTVGAQPLRYISDVLRTLNKRQGWSLAYKPFWNRLAKPAFPAMMKALFQRMCSELTTRVLKHKRGTVVQSFSAILVDDGSSFAVADGLRRVFPGRFTKVTPAAVELHAHMDLARDNLLSVALAPDKEAERQFLPSPESLPAASLSLRDRGYIDLGYFEALEARPEKAFLICRAAKGINPTVVAIHGVSSRFAKRWTGKRLSEIGKAMLRKNHELTVSWTRPGGKELRLRMIIRYVPEKRGWTWLLTNLPRSKNDADTVAELYRLRWQIELVFKDWKSNANLHALESEHPSIVEGFIWASLCAAFLKRALGHWAQVLCNAGPISPRLAAIAGPQVLPDLADWAEGGFRSTRFDTILGFLASNARRTNLKRDKQRTRALLGLSFAAGEGGRAAA
jgi:hypothetical protein